MEKVNFNLRSQKDKNKETPINLVVRWKGKRAVVSTGVTVKPNDWDTANQRKKQISIPRGYSIFELSREEQEEYNSINTFNDILKSKKKEIENIFSQYRFKNKKEIGSVEELKELLNPSSSKKLEEMSFFDYYDYYLTIKDYHPKTLAWYVNTRYKLEDFNKKLDFDSIDLVFHKNFKDYLRGKGLAKNTIAKHIQNIKSVLNHATGQGVNTNLAYQNSDFKKETEESINIYLEEEEVQQIFDLDLSDNPKLDRARDLFIVGCRTGLRFSDFSSLQEENFQGDFIEVQTVKMDHEVVIPIHPMVRAIRDKYKGKTANGLPPSISNQKLNDYIKEFTQKIESLKKVKSKRITLGGKRTLVKKPKYAMCSSHTARRTFASLEYRNKVPMITIMSIISQKSTETFLKYVKITPKEHAQIMKEIWEERLSKNG